MASDASIQERRRGSRDAAAYPVAIRGAGGRLIARGRTANISAHGAFVVLDGRRDVPRSGRLRVDIQVPDAGTNSRRKTQARTVSYTCRIVRAQSLGNLLGLGLEFVEKLD